MIILVDAPETRAGVRVVKIYARGLWRYSSMLICYSLEPDDLNSSVEVAER
jgi:hypothetical protein